MKKLISLLLVAATLAVLSPAVLSEEAGGLVLTAESHLQLDREEGYIDGIDGIPTVSELAAEFEGAVTVLGADGTEKSGEDAVAADDLAVCGKDSLKALIYGDVDRNGRITLTDVTATLKHIAGWGEDISAAAANVASTAEGAVGLEDAVKLLKYISGWSNISLGDVRMIYENSPLTAEHDDPTLDVFFADMMYKLGREQTEHTGEYAAEMKLAKNETESCQALLLSTLDREGLSAEISDFEYEYGDYSLPAKLEWIEYYDHSILTKVNPISQMEWYFDEFPEIVLPVADSFELQANKLRHLIISVTSETDSPEGMYTATLSIKAPDGTVIKTARVYAHVWDFALPDEPYSASLFCTQSKSGKNNKYSYKDYYDYMLDNNLSSYVLPYDIGDPRADEYMSDPRVTAFVIAGDGYGGIMNEDDADTKAFFEKVMTNPDWARKGLFYYTDEPYGTGLELVKTTYEHLIDVLGTEEGVRNMTPLAGNNSYISDDYLNKGIDPVAYIDPYINVWCPQSPAYHRLAEGGLWTPRQMVRKHGEFPERIAKFKEQGEESWWYVCCSPEIPYANYFTWYQGVIIRVLSWQQYFNDVDGVLYYGTGVHWDNISKYQFDIYNGDGVLMYPGEFFGSEGPQASWRLYQLRDGFDDFDYLRMAEELCGREAVMEVVNTVTSGMLKFTEDYRVLDAARDEIVNMILSAKD